MRQWLRVQMADDPSVADIFVLGVIGDWIDDYFGFDDVMTAKIFQGELDALPDAVKTLRVHVNSPGGDVFGAVQIANALKDQRISKGRTVETIVEGLAASAASILIQAGEPIKIGDNALIMIHEPTVGVRGTARQMRKVADELDTVTQGAIINTYKWHSKLTDDEIVNMMAETTWMDADEAIANGFATEKVEGLKAAAKLECAGFELSSVPGKYQARVEALLAPAKDEEPGDETPADAADVLKACREGGCLDIAEDLVAAKASLKAVRARIASERATRTKADERATQIRGLCQKAKLDDLAGGYIEGGMSVDAVKKHLVHVTAKLDSADIDGGLPPDHGQPNTGESWKNAFSRARSRFGARQDRRD